MKLGRVVSILTGIGIIIFISVLLFMIRQGRGVFTDPRTAVPPDASVIIETRNLPQLISQFKNGSLVWNELSQFNALKESDFWLYELDSLFKTNDFLAQWLVNRKTVISFRGTARRQCAFLLSVALNETEKDIEVEQQLRSVLAGTSAPGSSSRQGNGQFTMVIRGRGSERTVHMAVYGKMLLAGSSPLDLEEALARVKKRVPFRLPPGYVRVSGTAGTNVTANIYVQHQQLPAFLISLFQGMDGGKLGFLSGFAQWSECDLRLRNDIMVLNGFSFPGDSLNTTSSLFLSQDPSEIRAVSLIPRGVPGFIDLQINNFRQYFNAYATYLSRLGKYDGFRKNLEAANDSAGVNWVDFYTDIMDGEMGIIFLGTSPGKDDLHFMRVKSEKYTRQRLEAILAKQGASRGIPTTKPDRQISIRGDSVYRLYELPVYYLNKTILGTLFDGSEDRYCTLCNNYLLFADRESTLRQVLDSVAAGQVMNHDISYHAISANMDNRSNFTFYFNVHDYPGYFDNLFYPDSMAGKMPHPVEKGTLQAIVYQFSHENSLIYNNLVVKHVPVHVSADLNVWKTSLEAPVAGKPQMVTNHNTGNGEIMLQDTLNNLYLLSSNGTILWEIQLKEPILGEIFQVDFFKNGKMQYVFNTASAIYLVDRRGKFSANFPVSLRNKASNGMTVVDYDKKREYRYFLATANHKILALDRTGKILKGWKFEGTKGTVSQPVQYFRINDKDYFLASDQLQVYLLNRKGEDLLEPGLTLAPSKNPFFLEKEGEDYRFIFTDAAGNVCSLSPEGKLLQKKIGNFSPAHFFLCQDLDGDGTPEYIFVDGKMIGVYRSDGAQLFSHTFASNLTQPAVVADISPTNCKIGLYVESEHKIYLFNLDGSLQAGFPVNGSASFVMGSLGAGSTYNLIVGGKENFLYNFIVQYLMP